MWWGYYTSYYLLIPAILFTFYAQAKVSSNFKRYSKVRNDRNLTGAQAARMVLDANGLRDVQIETVRGSLTDHYDPRGRVLRLSETVCNVNSIAAVSVACHEAGHALQHAQNYVPLKIRNGIVPVVNLASNLCWPLAIIGIILLGNGSYIGDTLFNIAVIAMLAVILFHAVTLPVEFNASRRALQQMEELGIVDDMELPGAKKVLRAAAMTYVAALATAIANLLRLLNLPETVLELLKSGFLTTGHAKVVLGLPTPELQEQAAQIIADNQLNVRQAEALCKKLAKPPKAPAEPAPIDTLPVEVEESLKEVLGSEVNVAYHGGKGKLTVHFYSDEQLKAFANLLGKYQQ